MTNWPKGSQWRKWDLHVHSPASYGFSGDWNQFVIQLGNADCDVIGINDYFSVAGYREILRRLNDPGAATEGNKPYREALEKLRNKTLLPVVECRMNNILLNKQGKSGPRINFHLIFSPDLNPDDIETFIKGLKADGSSIGARYSDSQFLLDKVSVAFQETCRALRNDGTFAGRFLVWLPYDEYGGIDAINPSTDKLLKERLICDSDILGSSNKQQADFFLWKDTKFTEDQYTQWFGKRKPCIKGSDSHNVNDELGKLKDHQSKPTDKYCWIKSDPTFDGLRQIINEPEDRVFIGALPPKMAEVKQHPTRYLTRIKVGKVAGADTAEIWFDSDIALNYDMVAIIGNKGCGKSALADILALMGNSHCDPKYFSFLNKERFCERNGRIAKQFQATAHWADGTTSTRSLNEKPDPNAVELVKYIPQTYLEKVCTETDPGQKSEFQRELRKVIFSHITEANRLGKSTLDELIEYKTEELVENLAAHRYEMSRINDELVKLEGKGTPQSVAMLESQLALKQKELAAHITNKPAIVEMPNNQTPEQKAANEAIASGLHAERATLADVEAKIVSQQARQKVLTEHLATAKKVEGKLGNFQAEHDRILKDTLADLKELSIDFGDLVKFTIDKAPLANKVAAINTEKSFVDSTLQPDTPDSLPKKKQVSEEKIKALQEKLDAPNKAYQQYQESLKAWDDQRKAIEGSADNAGSLKFYEAQLKYVKDKLPVELAALRTEREGAARTIYKGIAAIRNVYGEMFAAVQELISGSVVIKEGFKLTFDSSIVERSFERVFFDTYVNQGVSGSFCGKEKGVTLLQSLREEHDFNTADDALNFANSIMEHLQNDKRSAQPDPIDISGQLRKHVGLKQFYDYLWSFEYLEPEYSLRLDGKDLVHLSPGERGTLLLVFYLLVDHSSNPIIVDQPEENLDSQTVYRLLIPVIKEVKKRRQIIMVTHSPNIAVVCDAEQIIHSFIDRSNKNAVIYKSGSIESTAINKSLVDVLEGTRPAFDNRDSKYQPTLPAALPLAPSIAAAE
jgi:ABC-type lipoprotein export system ATPase subunit